MTSGYPWWAFQSAQAVALEPLHINGRLFATLNDQPLTWKMASDFLLFERFHNGQDIVPLVRERQALGANGVHVIGMCGFDGHVFTPESWPDYYSSLGSFFDLLAALRMYCEFVPLTGVRALLPHWTHDDHVEHQMKCAAIERRRSNVFDELTNEYNHSYAVGLDVENFDQPAAILSSRGSGKGDTDPALPPWSYLTFHPGRSDEWPRKMKTALEYAEVWQRPCVSNEPMGAGEVDEPGRRATYPPDFYDAGACAALMSAGATFMSESGKWSEPYGPVQTDCARAFYAGLNVIPAGVGNWQYAKAVPGGFCLEAHDNDGTPDCALRTFGMLRGNEQWAMAVRPGPQWTAKPINGWVIQETHGRGNVLRLTR